MAEISYIIENGRKLKFKDAYARNAIKDIQGQMGESGKFTVDETLTYENGVLSVNTADAVEEDNTLPITSAAVNTTVGNIEVLLKTI